MVSIAKRIPRYVEPQIRYMAAKAATILVRDGALSLTFPFRVFFLFDQTRFVRCARPPGGFSFFRNDERLCDGFTKPSLSSFAISELAASIACNKANCSVLAQS